MALRHSSTTLPELGSLGCALLRHSRMALRRSVAKVLSASWVLVMMVLRAWSTCASAAWQPFCCATAGAAASASAARTAKAEPRCDAASCHAFCRCFMALLPRDADLPLARFYFARRAGASLSEARAILEQIPQGD